MRQTNTPVGLNEAINSIASFNGETVDDVLKRHPKMVSDNVYEDDESIVLLPKRAGESCDVYDIEKIRLDEPDWIDHLNTKGWVDMAMIIEVKKAIKKYGKRK